MTATNQRVPELVAGIDVRTLPLSAVEGFVLSRIDGKSSVGDIVALTGLGPDQVVGILDKLITLGAVRYRGQGDGFDPPSGLGSRRVEPGSTGVHTTPLRKRAPSHSPSPHHRRVFSESGVSSPPAELPPQSTRPRSGSESGAPSRIHAMPSQRAQASQTPEVPAQAQLERALEPGPPSDGRGDAAAVPSGRPPGSVLAPPLSILQPPAGPVSRAPSAAPQEAAYDVRELDEEVDLPRERRKQVLDLFYRLAEIDYYEALAVPYAAEKKEIRSAYFVLSKAFHPDSMFRKELGTFKAKMVAVFQFLTEAYETLGKKKNRAEYDAYLRTTKAARMAERALSFEPAEAVAGVESASPLGVPAGPLPPEVSHEPPPLPPLREASPEARRLAQEVIGRRLRGVVTPARPATATAGSSGAHPSPSPAPGAPGDGEAFDGRAKTDTHELLRRLTRTLRDVGQLTGSNDRITRAVRASIAAVERGDLSEATQQAARAASLAPERPELKAEHARLSVSLSEKLANTYIEQARFEMKHGKWASAALTWTKVCEGRPSDASAHRSAAQSLLKAGGDMRGAQRYAQKAVFLAPTDIESRILLAQICLTIGLKLNARRELEAAAKLDPANEMVKNLLADLDKG